ncbi:MAG: DUF2306 domain-containing protein [Chloroflexi bacterium]|nr:DUF2306 domain-containing protein [Chloroflexota bacterium]
MVRALWGAVIILAVIGIAAVIRRMLVLSDVILPFDPPQAPGFDAGFARHPLLTLVHIVPGSLFMILGPLQFVRRIRSRYITVHRWSGRVLVASGVVIGLTALTMSFQMAIGGANETAATTFFAVIFLFALGKAFLHIRRREIAQHREWMIRAFAIGLAVATVRPIVGMFFALSNLSPQEFFGIAFWLGFTLHLIAAEIWINYTRPKLTAQLPVEY